MSDYTINDGVLRADYVYCNHDDTFTRALTQPTEDLILDRNRELRKNPGALRDLECGRQIASIPLNIYYKALRDGYNLNSDKGMFAFLQTDLGKACLVQERI